MFFSEIEAVFLSISLTRSVLDRITAEMKYIISFTHETLWVVTHSL